MWHKLILKLVYLMACDFYMQNSKSSYTVSKMFNLDQQKFKSQWIKFKKENNLFRDVRFICP